MGKASRCHRPARDQNHMRLRQDRTDLTAASYCSGVHRASKSSGASTWELRAMHAERRELVVSALAPKSSPDHRVFPRARL